MELFPEEPGVCAPHQGPQLLDCAQRDEPPKCLTLKTSGDYIQENHRTVVNRELTLKGLMYRVTHLRTQCKNTSLKST